MSKQIKVLMSAFACEPDEGSEPEVGWQWATLMARHCDVTVLTQSKNRDKIEGWMDARGSEAPEINFEYHELPEILRRIKKISALFNQLYYLAWQKSAQKKVAEIVDAAGIELMHHVTYASFRYPVIKTKLPVIWGPVGGAEICPRHLLLRNGKMLGVVRELCRNFMTWSALKLVRVICPTQKEDRPGLVLASTPKMQSDLGRYGIASELFPTIGIDSDAFIEKESPEDQDIIKEGRGLNLIYVGRLHPLKGLHLVLEALGQINDSKITLSIIGSGSDKGRLEKLVSKFGIEDQVSFEGYVERVDLPDWFARKDVLVATSLYESGGLSVLEAGANGVPAIVLNCGGHALSVPEDGGYKIDPTSPALSVIDEIAEAIRSYQKSPELIKKHGVELGKHLNSNYEWENKSQRMLEYYHDVKNKNL